jgi:hypothetical protein
VSMGRSSVLERRLELVFALELVGEWGLGVVVKGLE